MGQEDAEAFFPKELILRKFLPDIETVAVAVHAHYRLAEVADLLHEAEAAAPVARMPDDVDRSEEIGELLGEHSMGVR